ncbi:MAG TPA: hypothetical protein VE338_01690 [Ktedonobacterales bacterium]|nr:hypothetical protein [Ktedonobacterales bacterium]
MSPPANLIDVQHPQHTAHQADEAHTGHRTSAYPADGSVHLLFGSVEELLADLAASGGPEGGIVRVERLVRSQPAALGGTATFGVVLTARRATEISEVLSAWVIVARVALDPWGRPVSPTQAQEARRRHHEAQRLLSAFVADAGYTPRSGTYLLSEACYGFTATAEPLSAAAQSGPVSGAEAEKGANLATEQGDHTGERETNGEPADGGDDVGTSEDNSEGGAADA